MRLDVSEAKTAFLPCGCKMIGSASFIGIDGRPIEHVLRFDAETGDLTVFAATLDPSQVKHRALQGVDARGRATVSRVLTREGIQPVDVVAPFEVHCKRHGVQYPRPSPPPSPQLARIELFHAHLDTCTQCREHPFELCPIGAPLLKAAAT
jgi:hypothetical protein